MIYRAKITGFGEMAMDFLSENILIIFNNTAPAELADLSVLHDPSDVVRNVKVGDKVRLGNHKYDVTAVGDEANETLKLLGHCTLCFKGLDQVELPGQIMLKGTETPTDLTVGDLIIFE